MRVQCPKMRLLSILVIESDLKWCIDLSRSLFVLNEKLKDRIKLSPSLLFCIIRNDHVTAKIYEYRRNDLHLRNYVEAKGRSNIVPLAISLIDVGQTVDCIFIFGEKLLSLTV